MKINTPPVLLGYEPSRSTVSFGSAGGAQQRQTSKCDTYLQLFVTIEPQLQPAQPLAEKVENHVILYPFFEVDFIFQLKDLL